MCGILFHHNSSTLFDETKSIDDIDETTLFGSLIPIIRERGGDFEKYHVFNHAGNTADNHIEIYSSVLSLRQPYVIQPIVDSRFIIQFNGELYNEEIKENMNDVEFLHHRLITSCDNDVIKCINGLEGEFAYTIVDKLESKVYFGKDIMGRKALCYSYNEDELYISSCPPKDKQIRQNFIECRNACVFVYDIQKKNIDSINFEECSELPDMYKVLNNPATDDFKESEMTTALHRKITQAVEKRISTIFPLDYNLQEDKSKFSILFSGGIDCTIIAGICGETCERGTVIDLLNVSFSNPRAKLNYDETPDRKLGIKNCDELNKKYNSTTGVLFRLVKVDVSYEEYTDAKNRVMDLIYPNDTEMDLSIAIAFYFATSGNGSNNISSNCKVLLSGLGADEIFGGYTRHERIFTGISNQKRRVLKNKPRVDDNVYDLKELNVELRDELQCDLDRLWERNLCRDDKVICCWEKEARYPFLDESLIRWSTSEGNVPIDFKLYYNETTGEIVRKRALRCVAKNAMGLEFVSEEPKRAVQFGAKSAKMEIGSGKVKGTDKIQL